MATAGDSSLGADHLAALLLRGEGAAGSYTPERVTLALSGTDRMADPVVYLHELHHRGLNDSTAWGQRLADLCGAPAAAPWVL